MNYKHPTIIKLLVVINGTFYNDNFVMNIFAPHVALTALLKFTRDIIRPALKCVATLRHDNFINTVGVR
jgi:hypothetical protein